MANDQVRDITVRRKQVGKDPELDVIDSKMIVPGDVIVVPEGYKIPCDAILLNGECVVNEAMLTGESIPQIKVAIPKNDAGDESIEDFSIENKRQCQYFLFAGTEIMQVRKAGDEGVLALVTRTGFSTTKGKLIRSIMYAAPKRFDFYRDTYIVLAIVITLAFGASISVLPTFIDYYSGYHIIVRYLNTFTIAIPAALPIVISAATMIAAFRLNRGNIFCSTTAKISASGRVSIMVLDKTGTLTLDNLNTVGFKLCEAGNFQHSKRNTDDLIESNEIWENANQYGSKSDSPNVKFIECMASWHSIKTFKEKRIGDPLEIEMFESTGWEIDENENEQGSLLSVHPKAPEEEENEDAIKPVTNIILLKRFDFDSTLQRMSVIVESEFDGTFIWFAKGSPESIYDIWKSDSLPEDYFDKQQKYSQHGLRIIALCYKLVDINGKEDAETTDRDQEKSDFIFLGFIIFANKLKVITKKTIDQLHEGGVNTLMATGDNALTAVNVAKKWNIVLCNDCYYFDMSNPTKSPDNISNLECYKIAIKQEFNEDDELALDNITNSDGDNVLDNDKREEIKEALRSRSSDERPLMLDSNEDYSSTLKDLMSEQGYYEIAITGRAFEHIRKLSQSDGEIYGQPATEVFKNVLRNGKVFARMSPEQKADMIEEIQNETDEIIGMWGDGANDCTALKRADVGLSLSEAEASVAAPFTSRTPNISAIVILLRQGRASLELWYALFQYIIIYSWIQFTTVMILNYSCANFHDNQFGYINVLIVCPTLGLMCLTFTNDKLISKLPHRSMLSAPLIVTIVGQVFIWIMGQIIIYVVMRGQDWFHSNPRNSHMTHRCYECTVLFWFSVPQYIFLSVIINISPGFRDQFYYNYLFMLVLAAWLGISYWIIIHPTHWFRERLHMRHIDRDFRVGMTLSSVGNGLIMVLFQFWVFWIFGAAEKRDVKTSHEEDPTTPELAK